MLIEKVGTPEKPDTEKNIYIEIGQHRFSCEKKRIRKISPTNASADIFKGKASQSTVRGAEN